MKDTESSEKIRSKKNQDKQDQVTAEEDKAEESPVKDTCRPETTASTDPEEYVVIIEQADGLDSEDGDTEQTSLLEQSKSQETQKDSRKRPREESKEEVVKEKNWKDTDPPKSKKAQDDKRNGPDIIHEQIAKFKIPKIVKKRKAKDEGARNSTETEVKRLKMDEYRQRKEQEKKDVHKKIPGSEC